MHDLDTIKKMNAEQFGVGDYVKVREDTEVAGYVGLVGRVVHDDLADSLNLLVNFPDSGLADAYFSTHELQKQGNVANEEQLRAAQEKAEEFMARTLPVTGFNLRGLLTEVILSERGLELPG